jgi:maltooligosyltrehalose trehalohydrolase
MQFKHAMPFGAQIDADGAARFRLWAPGASEVDIEISATQSRLGASMSKLGDGWFETSVRELAPGARYGFRIDGGLLVPDPASRFNPEDVHAPSMLVEPTTFAWDEIAWRGRPWHEAVVYELHVGTFTPAGTFRRGRSRRSITSPTLGVTAIELMPIAEFPRDGATGATTACCRSRPRHRYGRPDDLKALVFRRRMRTGIMVLLDVVYNHFGPEGKLSPTCTGRDVLQ